MSSDIRYRNFYFSASYLSYRISFSLSLACLSGISDLVFGFYRSNIATYLNQVRNARRRSFSTRFSNHNVISACMHQRGDQVEGSRGCRTCYTRVRERHVPLGAVSQPRLMFQRCRVRRRSCCSLYHRDLGGINRETRLFDRDQRTRILQAYRLHRVTSYPKCLILVKRTYKFDKAVELNLKSDAFLKIMHFLQQAIFLILYNSIFITVFFFYRIIINSVECNKNF